MTVKVHLITTTDPDTGQPVTVVPDCTMTDDCQYCTPETRAERHAEAKELARLEAEFAAAGGRGVDLAERIDALRARLDAEPLDVTAELFDGDGDREYGQVRIGDFIITVHESLTEPGRVVVDIDQRPESTAPLAVTVNDDRYLLGDPAPAAAHDCGLCDGPLRFDGRTPDGQHTLWTCPACGWQHVSVDCCDPAEVTP